MRIYQNENVLARELGVLKVGVFEKTVRTEMEGTKAELIAHAKKLDREPNVIGVIGYYK